MRHGGILFRGYALGSPADFRACAEVLEAKPFTYVGGNTPRANVAQDVFSSTEFPSSEFIALHNEMSYLPTWPRRIFFYSAVPARVGGQTTLASGRDVLGSLPRAIVDRFRNKRLNYIRHFYSHIQLGKTWQATYETEDRDELLQIVARQGSTCSWLAGDVLRVTTLCDAVIEHPETGEEVWFNQAEQWHPSALVPEMRAMFQELVGSGRLPHDCEFGDGEPLDERMLATVRQALHESKLLFDWMRSSWPGCSSTHRLYRFTATVAPG